MVVMGRTNMVEFAFSGLGVNPHFGTPTSPYDRATGRLPGGSSSGAAVAAADGAGFGGLGSDTGGSCRIPAALWAGWSATSRRRGGCRWPAPIRSASRSIPSAPSRAASAAARRWTASSRTRRPCTLRCRWPDYGWRSCVTMWRRRMETAVANAYAAALSRLAAAGAVLTDMRIEGAGNPAGPSTPPAVSPPARPGHGITI